MEIHKKTPVEIAKMYEAGQLLASCHQAIANMIEPGITTLEIDDFVECYLQKHGATPEQKGYKGYPYATCASINDEICHGFPRASKLKEGDIVTIDMVVNLDGALADSAWTYSVGQVADECQQLMDVTKTALYKGIDKAFEGNTLGDIGSVIQQYVEGEQFSIVREFSGHGIGPTLHENPLVPHFGKEGRGPVIEEGMVITIEPMVNEGAWKSKMDNNGWTARTIDGKRSAQYEHTIAITENGPLILTEQR